MAEIKKTSLLMVCVYILLSFKIIAIYMSLAENAYFTKAITIKNVQQTVNNKENKHSF